jgi:hypothetical protein
MFLKSPRPGPHNKKISMGIYCAHIRTKKSNIDAQVWRPIKINLEILPQTSSSHIFFASIDDLFD